MFAGVVAIAMLHLSPDEGEILANLNVANSVKDDYDWVVGIDSQIGEYGTPKLVRSLP